jgi:hypothetical protein
LLSGLTASDRPTLQTEAQVEPAAVLAPTAQGVVAGDLQAQLQELYEEVNPSVVNIRVSGNLMGGMIPGLPEMPQLPGDGQLPNLDQLPERCARSEAVSGSTEPRGDSQEQQEGQQARISRPGSARQKRPCCR